MLSMKEPQEGEAPPINQRYPRYNQSSSLRLSQFMWDTHFLPLCFQLQNVFPRQLVEPRGCRQKSEELWGIIKENKRKGLFPHCKETSYAGVACSGENYTIVMHHVQGGQKVNNPLPSGSVLF